MLLLLGTTNLFVLQQNLIRYLQRLILFLHILLLVLLWLFVLSDLHHLLHRHLCYGKIQAYIVHHRNLQLILHRNRLMLLFLANHWHYHKLGMLHFRHHLQILRMIMLHLQRKYNLMWYW